MPHRNLPPISPEGLGGLLLWLAQAKIGKPDHSLLLRGLPQGRVKRARVTDDGAIAVTFTDQRDGTERNERYFDPEFFFVMRLLFAAKTYVRVDRNKKKLHYVTMFDDITALRVITDAQSDQEAKYFGDHYHLRRGNLFLRKAVLREATTKPRHQGRDEALTLSLVAYDKLSESHWLKRMFLRDDLVWLVTEGFTLLDKLPLGTTEMVRMV